MSLVSPYARSATERGTHWQTTALFMGVAATIFYVAASLVTPSFEFRGSESEELSDASHRSAEETVAPRYGHSGADDSVDWSARIAAIEQALPDSDDNELIVLQQRLQSLRRTLPGETLPANVQESILDALSRLQQQAVVLHSQSDSTNVNLDRFREAIARNVQLIRSAEQQATQQAIDEAKQPVRKQMGKLIRKQRLAIRDYQDEVITLRQHITQIQREQSLSRDRKARAEALARDMGDVRRYLTPFTSPGHVQPNKTFGPVNITITIDAMPVSLSALNEFNALERSAEGLKRLHRFGGANSAAVRNDRPFGEFPTYPADYLKNPEVLATLKRAQQLLREHGQALIEAKLLSP